MTELRDEEKVVAATIEATLGLGVEQFDDGSLPSMHDLNIVDAHGDRAAVEVTAAADPDSIQLWKLVNGRDERWVDPNLRGGWMLQLEPTARANRLLRDLPAFLKELEGNGVKEIPSRRSRHEMPDSIEGRARDLGIVGADQYDTTFPGSIYLTIERSRERTGGMVDDTGSVVTDWVREFLLAPHQSDVLKKLARSGATQRHVAILIPAFSTAPFGVLDMLWRDLDDVVPIRCPNLPNEVTHVWLMSFWAIGSGLRWSSEGGWERFARKFYVEG